MNIKIVTRALLHALKRLKRRHHLAKTAPQHTQDLLTEDRIPPHHARLAPKKRKKTRLSVSPEEHAKMVGAKNYTWEAPYTPWEYPPYRVAQRTQSLPDLTDTNHETCLQADWSAQMHSDMPRISRTFYTPPATPPSDNARALTPLAALCLQFQKHPYPADAHPQSDCQVEDTRCCWTLGLSNIATPVLQQYRYSVSECTISATLEQLQAAEGNPEESARQAAHMLHAYLILCMTFPRLGPEALAIDTRIPEDLQHAIHRMALALFAPDPGIHIVIAGKPAILPICKTDTPPIPESLIQIHHLYHSSRPMHASDAKQHGTLDLENQTRHRRNRV